MAEIDFIKTSAQEVYDTFMEELENGVSEPLYPGDERRIAGESFAYLVTLVFNEVNDKCRQRLLRYARNDVLEALGEGRDTARLDSTLAETTLRFGVNAALATNIIIPARLRVTNDFVHYFLTDETVVLPAGSMYVDVSASAEFGGNDYNDIAAGEIKNIVDVSEIPMIDYVANLDITHGGGDSETDDAYRERIRSAENALSTAGTEGAYRYFAMSANPRISDVVIESETETVTRTLKTYAAHAFQGGANLLPETLIVYLPDGSRATEGTDYTATYEDELLTLALTGGLASAEMVNIEITRNMYGRVKIIPICAGGELPDADILADVLAACTAEDVKVFTDKVIVEAPDVAHYDIELTYYTTKADASAVIENIEGAGGAIDQYIYWQDSNLKQDINPEELFMHVKNAGATRVEIVKPVYRELDSTTVAKFSGNRVVNHVIKG